MAPRPWHTLSSADLFQTLSTSTNGLSTSEAAQRLEHYGRNELPKPKRDSLLRLFFRQLVGPMELLLIFAMAVSFFIGEFVDGFAILFIILADVILGAVEEWNAGKTAESLASLIRVQVRVLRDGVEQEIDSSLLTVGDLVLLDSGDKVSADLRILECTNFQIDESILTGESLPVTKSPAPLAESTPLADRRNMLYAGTSVVTGRARAVVVAVGVDTEVGKIADTVTKTAETKSPLSIRMEKFTKQISLFVVGIAVFVAIILLSKGTPGSEILLSVIALAVSAMPEGLALALTMALTIASNRMSKQNVVVKKLSAVESLGSCTVIASDKTGTLTVNEQTAKRILLPNGASYSVSGTGYNDRGEVIAESDTGLDPVHYLARLAALNTEAKLEKHTQATPNSPRDTDFETFGDSIDIAFLALARKLGALPHGLKITSRIPYESENKYSAVFYRDGDQEFCTAKGSLEVILDLCADSEISGQHFPLDRKKIAEQNEYLAREGYRVIAVAAGPTSTTSSSSSAIPSSSTSSSSSTGTPASTSVHTAQPARTPSASDPTSSIASPATPPHTLHFLGLVAFIDPVRDEVKSSIAECRRAGIQVLMITGDHPLTAFSIANELGLAKHLHEVTTGAELDQHFQKGEKSFDAFVRSHRIFTRVTPENKLQIVESLKRQGEFVAVTGDGINDAPALKAANIGVAMGSGTDVAKETADLIIIDDNFRSIVSGIREGRGAYANIRKVSFMLISCGVAEVLFFCLSILGDMPMPLVAIQLLWLNLVTDGLQDFALSFEKPEAGTMLRPPVSPKDTIFNRELITEVALSGVTIGLIVFAVWVFLLRGVGMDVTSARGYIMVLMVFIQNMHVLNCRSERTSTFRIPLRENLWVPAVTFGTIILQFIVSEIPALSAILQASSVPLLHLLILFALSSSIIVVVELYKRFLATRLKS